MQKDLWKSYELEWLKFKKDDDIHTQAPIPPSCRIMTLHIFMTKMSKSLASIKNISDILAANDQNDFKECFKEAKRRLQMCSFRIIDEHVFLDMKNEMT
jgi:hypothetical protein